MIGLRPDFYQFEGNCKNMGVYGVNYAHIYPKRSVGQSGSGLSGQWAKVVAGRAVSRQGNQRNEWLKAGRSAGRLKHAFRHA